MMSASTDMASVIERVRDTYASARFYADHGAIEAVNTRVTFETAFARPDSFLYSFSATAKDGETHARRLLRKGERLRIGDPKWRHERPESLDAALATFTALTFGSAQVVPLLLMPEEISGRRIFDRPRSRLVASAEIDGEAHVVIAFEDENRGAEHVYVNERRWTLRRIVWSSLVRTTTLDYREVRMR